MARKFADYRKFIDREMYGAHFAFPIVSLISSATVSKPARRPLMTHYRNRRRAHWPDTSCFRAISP